MASVSGATAVVCVAGMLAGAIAFGVAGRSFLDPGLVLFVAACVGGLAFVACWRRRRRRARELGLWLFGCVGFAVAAVITIDRALDWHAPETHVVAVHGSRARRIWLRSGVSVERHVLTSSWRDRDEEAIAVHEPAPFERHDFRAADLLRPLPPATAWQMAVVTRAGALGLAYVVSYSYRSPEAIAGEGRSEAIASLADVVARRLADNRDDAEAQRLQSAVLQLQGRLPARAPPDDARSLLLRSRSFRPTTPADEELQRLIAAILTTW